MNVDKKAVIALCVCFVLGMAFGWILRGRGYDDNGAEVTIGDIRIETQNAGANITAGAGHIDNGAQIIERIQTGIAIGEERIDRSKDGIEQGLRLNRECQQVINKLLRGN